MFSCFVFYVYLFMHIFMMRFNGMQTLVIRLAVQMHEWVIRSFFLVLFAFCCFNLTFIIDAY